MKYMYAIMDDETRFWIAQQVSGSKYVADVRPLFKKAKEIAGKRPNVLISDELQSGFQRWILYVKKTKK